MAKKETIKKKIANKTSTLTDRKAGNGMKEKEKIVVKSSFSDEEIKKWEESNNKNVTEIIPNEYLGVRGLELIENLEGHKKGFSKDNKGIPTTYYGITQAGLDGLRELSDKFYIKLPAKLVGKTIDKLSRADAALAAQYLAALNTKLVDRITNTSNFSSLTLSEREAFLSYFHNVSPHKLKKSYIAGKDGSCLKAIAENNPYRALQTLLEDSDGNLLGEYIDEKGKKNGFVKRSLVPSFAYGNDVYSFSPTEATQLENNLRSQKEFIKKSHEKMGVLAKCRDQFVAGCVADGNLHDELVSLFSQLKENKDTTQKDMQEKPAEKDTTEEMKRSRKNPALMSFDNKNKNEQQGFSDKIAQVFSDFTNNLKNLFTNNDRDKDSEYSGNMDLSDSPQNGQAKRLE